MVATVERPKCRHCQRKPVNRPRGYCWGCYYTPGVRESYGPSTSRYAVHGVGNLTGVQPLPAEPCPYPPGSEGRIDTLAGRARRGEQLWHPADAGYGEAN